VAGITGAYRQMVARAHAHGIRVMGATIMPFGGNEYYHPGAETEADRQAINSFIRQSGTFDGVIDFDRLTRDPARPEQLAAGYDGGDHLHPSVAGYKAMGEAVPIALLSPAPTPAAGAGGRQIALTFDDIPVHGALPPGVSRVNVIRAITSALKEADAPAHGFFNGAFEAREPDSEAATAAWKAAGLPLGNHSFSHGNFAAMPADAFTADIARNEPMLKGQARWFRYPFLAEGETADKREAVRSFLRKRGYKVAAVTASFGDYAWAEPYARCARKGDAAAAAALEASFLAAARQDAENRLALSRAALGREIPLVLLMHVGALDARVMPRLLAQYRAMGFRFVTLAEAERDPFYASATDLGLPGPSPSLEAAAAARGVPIPPATPMPDPALCS
jgi:peptidoglycan/xylan/chitin deacetylase (PgdA/CDA1 family)